MPRTAQQSIDFNRRAKAEKIYWALKHSGVIPRHIHKFGDVQWSLAAELAGYKAGTKVSPETQGIVLDFVRNPEKLAGRVA
jgi:hypothetical protein